MRAAIFGFKGPELLPEEVEFFSQAKPWGFIVFQRNIDSPGQLCELTDHLKEISWRKNVPILIDQEGGRVRRLKPPHWREHPAVGRIAVLAEKDMEKARRAAYVQARIIAHDLHACGINVNCAPNLDLLFDGASDIVGDRSYGADPDMVALLGEQAIQGFLDGGVLPIMKHIPGHGRALVDSHDLLPHVPAVLEDLASSDFVPFRLLAQTPMAMTAHIVYDDVDGAQPATWSHELICDVIRDQIGFDGLLMSDDINMAALEGAYGDRARKVFQAGCDIVLHCNGNPVEMRAVSDQTPQLTGKSLERANAALDLLSVPKPGDIDDLHEELMSLIS